MSAVAKKKEAGESQDFTSPVSSTRKGEDDAKYRALQIKQEMFDERAAKRAKQRFLQIKSETGMTQEQVARRAGWGQGNLAVYLSGKKAIGRIALLGLCVALDCEPHDIRPELGSPEKDRATRRLHRELLSEAEFLRKEVLGSEGIDLETKRRVKKRIDNILEIVNSFA